LGPLIVGRFSGEQILVTGGSRGIGLEVSRHLAENGARVTLAARERAALDAALVQLDGSGHRAVALDVSDADGWRSAMRVVDSGGPLSGVVLAAGVLGPVGSIAEVDPSELVRAVEINLLGTLLGLHFAVPRLRASDGRAVTFSGGGGTSPLPRFDAYAASKAGVVRATENVAAAGEVEINAVAPGFVATRMHEGTLAAGPEAAGKDYYERTRAQLADGGFPARETAELVSLLLSSQAQGISGRLISAQWDPWREPAFLDRLRRQPDLATLRRIDDQFFTTVVRT
jgi:NAD(P)-dependent dehydrogenase (short-subunit alcohol dehydrogenase family)